MRELRWLWIAAMLAVAAPANADSITVDGVSYEDVIIREGANCYYIQVPTDGSTINVPKSNVDPADVVITKDKMTRDALLEQWREQNARREKPKSSEAKPVKPPSPPVPGAPPSPAAMPSPEYRPSGRDSAIVEKQVTTDPKGVRKLVLKGNRQKEEGFENAVEQQRRAERQRRIQEEEAAQQAQEQAAIEAARKEEEAMMQRAYPPLQLQDRFGGYGPATPPVVQQFPSQIQPPQAPPAPPVPEP